MNDTPLVYKGDKQPSIDERDSKGRALTPYLPSEDLKEAVNLAIQLEKPLLIKGEPGSGKTRLALAVAYEFGLHESNYFAWYVKSTSRARDGLYIYDAVGRLRDAQLAANKLLTDEQRARADEPESYVNFGPLGHAFRAGKRSIVLIDEIDKADIDFPNDLLLELDEKRFIVDELDGKEIAAKEPPIVFITSNDEKDLPDAFLRRCLFYYIEFPNEADLKKIVQAHFPSRETLIDAVVARFLELRRQMEEGRAAKKVTTSELLDWFKVLSHYEDDDVLARLRQDLIYPGVLLKNWDDYRNYPKLLHREPQPAAPPAPTPASNPNQNDQ